MSNLIRSAKSGSDWTAADLDAYNITIVAESAATFFGTQSLPQPHIDQEILEVRDAENMVSDKNAELVNLLDLAMIPSSEESAVDDFAVELFKALGYVRRNRIARTHKDIPLLICGELRHAKTDVCLLDRDQNDILLLVQEDKRFGQGENATFDAQGQLVAEAIGTFSYNNRRRTEAGLEVLDAKVIPGIIMTGTSPTFYKIPVTTQLEYNVRHGLFPSQPTRVAMHQPTVPRPNRRWSEGMKPLDSRSEILKCYEAFKAVVGI